MGGLTGWWLVFGSRAVVRLHVNTPDRSGSKQRAMGGDGAVAHADAHRDRT